MLTLLFRKMRNTKWMVICLLIGFIMATAMTSTIPIYMHASLQRMLIKDMQAYQEENNEYPGVYAVTKTIVSGTSAKNQRATVNNVYANSANRFNQLLVPFLNYKCYTYDSYLYVTNVESENPSMLKLGAMTEMDGHITMLEGRMYEPGRRDDGVYEVICTPMALQTAQITMGQIYEVTNIVTPGDTVKLEVVGTFTLSDETDTYWSEGMKNYDNTFFTDFDTLLGNENKELGVSAAEGLIYTGIVNITSVECRYIIDYHNMDMNIIGHVQNMFALHEEAYDEENVNFDVPAKGVLEAYADKAASLEYILLMLDIPVCLMLIFYLYMVSQLNIESEKNEIAMLKSRGASSWQILRIYAYETLILGAISALVGPFVGLGLCNILGVSNGFLEFVNRPALQAKLSVAAFLFAIVAVAVFFVTTLVPIIPASRISIVAHKQKKAKSFEKPFWQKMYLDFACLILPVVWLWFHNRREQKLIEQGISEVASTMNPLMFAVSTVFILGAGLVCVRLYPYFIRLVYFIGRKHWSPAAYISLNNIGRSSSGREKFIMIFLILTVALGIFSANTARAINRNTEERIKYNLGADVVLEEAWKTTRVKIYSEEDGGETSVTQYTEPVFERYETLAGVDVATPVFKRDTVQLRFNDKTQTDCQVMGIIAHQFADVCWFRDNLLPVHINHYINALSECQDGAIISSSYQEKYGVNLGDRISIKWSKNDWFEATVVAVVDYWPSLNPYERNSAGDYKDFVILNYDYINVMTITEPYQVWMSLKDDAKISDLYDSVVAADITATRLDVSSQMVTSSKTDAVLQGVNGALTLGFIIIMAMCFIGFLIYWILSIKGRTLQFGILRAMGMSFGEIISMIVYEQVLVSGVSIFLSIIIGGIASDLFVPLFQVLYNVTDQVPPFVVVSERGDYIKLYIIVLVMLLVGFAVIAHLIKQININKALKLGED
ncbi:MAG: FtsX-like permease family protein [Oscillospiraceae bacterium]|nr:FtsX-like permease family protein [Oscillospiraceae bacterium]